MRQNLEIFFLDRIMYFFNIVLELINTDISLIEDVNLSDIYLSKYKNCSAHLIQLIYLTIGYHFTLKFRQNQYIDLYVHHIKEWLDKNLLPNGCIYECFLYDSLDFQVESLLVLSFLIKFSPHLYNYKTKYKGSVQQSINFLIPYVLKKKLHICYIHSSNSRIWDCNDAKHVFRLYQYFDQNIKNIYAQAF